MFGYDEVCFVVVCFNLFGIVDDVIFDKFMMLLLNFGVGFEVFYGWLNCVLGNGFWCKGKFDILLYF